MTMPVELFSMCLDRVFLRHGVPAGAERWTYIHYVDLGGADEIYDPRDDPFDLKNPIADPRAPKKALQERVKTWRWG